MTSALENPMKLIHKHRAGWHCLLLVCVLAPVGANASSESKASPCDCGDVVFKPSKQRIPIARSAEVKQQLADLKSNPTERDHLHQIVKTADAVVQRHFNGDLYADHDPTGWEMYNGPLIAKNFDQWQQFRKNQVTQARAWISVCQTATLVKVRMDTEPTMAQYQLTQVGMFLGVLDDPKSRFDAGNRGQPLIIDVIFDRQAKVTETRWSPEGWSVGEFTYTKVALMNRLAKKPSADFGETRKQIDINKTRWRKQLADLEQAAKICAVSKKVEE